MYRNSLLRLGSFGRFAPSRMTVGREATLNPHGASAPSSSPLFPVSDTRSSVRGTSLGSFASPLKHPKTSLLVWGCFAENPQDRERSCRTSGAYARSIASRFSVTYENTRPQPRAPIERLTLKPPSRASSHEYFASPLEAVSVNAPSALSS